MKKDNTYYVELMHRYLNNECTAEELEEILDHIGKDESNRLLLEQLQASYKAALQDGDLPEVSGWSNRVRAALLKKSNNGTVIPFFKRRSFHAAAIVFLLLSAGALFYFSSRKTTPHPMVAETKSSVILPGSDKATLTLANGAVIDLNEAESGDIAPQGNAKVIIAGGKLNYVTTSPPGSSVVAYNTITTPRGGQYAVVLSDGSKVWLNAASSLQFPVSFNDKERKVTLTGEGYFEIAQHLLPGGKKQPFYVTVRNASGNGGTVEVLGTHFNIMAYDDEDQITTTLLEGSVKLNIKEETVLLKPGQQALVTKAGQLAEVLADVDTESAIAWKNGEFRFDNTDVKAIMRQIGRWYDVSIIYEGHIPEIALSGNIKRRDSIEQMLEILQATHKIRFRTAGKNIFVAAYKKS